MSIKKQIDELVAEGNLSAAIERIKSLKIEDSKFQSEIATLSGRYKRWQDGYHSGTSNDEKELNLITQSLLYYAGKCEGFIDKFNVLTLNATKNKQFNKTTIVVSVLLLIGCELLGKWVYTLKHQIKTLNKENMQFQTQLDSLNNSNSTTLKKDKILCDKSAKKVLNNLHSNVGSLAGSTKEFVYSVENFIRSFEGEYMPNNWKGFAGFIDTTVDVQAQGAARLLLSGKMYVDINCPD